MPCAKRNLYEEKTIRLTFIVIFIAFNAFSQVTQNDTLAGQGSFNSFNQEIKRVSNNWTQTVNEKIDTSKFTRKRLVNKAYSGGELRYYQTKEAYSKITKTFTRNDSLIKIIFYSLGRWPLQIETYINGNHIENLYFDKTNMIAWEKGENQFVPMNHKDFFLKNRQGLDLFDRTSKAARSKSKLVKEP